MVQEIVVEGHVATVVENHGTVVPGDGRSPPLVVDAPPLSDGLHPTGGAARETDVDGFAVLVGTDGHDPGAPQGAQPLAVSGGPRSGTPRRMVGGAGRWNAPTGHGSKLRRA